MPICAVLTCQADSEDSGQATDGLTFHFFPADKEVKSKWVDMTGRDNWIPTKVSVVCSKHFRENDYLLKRSGKRYLKASAIPCEYVVYRDLYPDEPKQDPPREEDEDTQLGEPAATRAPTPALSLLIPNDPDTTSFVGGYDLNDNTIGWDHFQPPDQYFEPMRYFGRPDPDSGETGGPSDLMADRYGHGSRSELNTPPPMDLSPNFSGLAPPKPPSPSTAMEQIKKAVSKRSRKAVYAATDDGIREAKRLRMQLEEGTMTEVEKAVGIIDLQSPVISSSTDGGQEEF